MQVKLGPQKGILGLQSLPLLPLPPTSLSLSFFYSLSLSLSYSLIFTLSLSLTCLLALFFFLPWDKWLGSVLGFQHYDKLQAQVTGQTIMGWKTSDLGAKIKFFSAWIYLLKDFKICIYLLIYWSEYVIHKPKHTWGVQRTACWCQLFFFPTVWVPGVELRLSGLTKTIFTAWAISLVSPPFPRHIFIVVGRENGNVCLA